MSIDHDDSVTNDRASVRAREEERFGGVKVGSAFFGWLTATAMTVLLTALVAAAGAGVGLVSSPEEAADAVGAQNLTTDEIGWAGVVLVLAIVGLAYFSGGYVAGRMARFDGVRQGVAVFGWAVVAAVVLAVLGLVAGAEYNVLDRLDSFPRIPDDLGSLSLQAVVALVGVVGVSLAGAIAGGLAGMSYHRRVDRAGVRKA